MATVCQEEKFHFETTKLDVSPKEVIGPTDATSLCASRLYFALGQSCNTRNDGISNIVRVYRLRPYTKNHHLFLGHYDFPGRNTDRIFWLQFSRTGNRLAVMWQNVEEITVLEILHHPFRFKEVATFRHGIVYEWLEFYTDHRLAVASLREKVQVWQVESMSASEPELVQEWEFGEMEGRTWDLVSFAWNETGTELLVAGSLSLSDIWLQPRDRDTKPFLMYLDVATGSITKIPFSTEINHIDVSGNLLAVALPEEFEVWIWDIQEKVQLQRIEVTAQALTWSQDRLLCLESGFMDSATLFSYSVGQDGNSVRQQFAYTIDNMNICDYEIPAPIPKDKGLMIFGIDKKDLISVRWKLPTLTDLCRETLEGDPKRNRWPAELAEFVSDEDETTEPYPVNADFYGRHP